MPIDDIVFTREALRRAMVSTVELLDDVSYKYDPEADLPLEDYLACVGIESVKKASHDYANAIKARIETRAGRTT